MKALHFYLGASLLLLVGCAWFHPTELKPVPVAAGQDAVVVNAQRVQDTSLFAYEQLTEFEYANRDSLPVAFSRAVDQIRAEFKPNWRASRKALEDYKARRGVSLEDVNRLTAALAAAQSAFLDLRGGQDAGSIATALGAVSRLGNNLKQLTAPAVVIPTP